MVAEWVEVDQENDRALDHHQSGHASSRRTDRNKRPARTSLHLNGACGAVGWSVNGGWIGGGDGG